MFNIKWALTLFIILAFCNVYSQFPKSEFRGVWIATVANIDWPSKGGLSSEIQQNEFVKILEMHKRNGMNAVVVQVRPAADAFYPSSYEPWSKWLTGKTGNYPFPYYDPLAFMIKEAHLRGMEFHAWLNPYRASMNEPDSASIVYKHPEWFLKYGKNMYFNPGLVKTREHVVNVVMDVVNRYEVDGIHFDDYFYPYKIAGEKFPDSITFVENKGAFSNIDDWRRNNVDLLIKKISDSIRLVKPYVKFGISPFGVWRNQSKDPEGSATRGGQTCYDDLYANVRKWLKEGWIDYVTPQIYWPFGHEAAPYEVLLDWWNKNSFGKPVLIGHGAYRIDSASKDLRWRNASHIPKQIRAARLQKDVKGSIFFSSKSFLLNPLGINDSLRNSIYRLPALPISKDKTDSNLSSPLPQFSSDGKSITLLWQSDSSSLISSHAQYVIYRFTSPGNIFFNDPERILTIYPNTFSAGSVREQFIDQTASKGKKYYYVITSIDKWGRESKPEKISSIKYNQRSWKVYLPVETK